MLTMDSIGSFCLKRVGMGADGSTGRWVLGSGERRE